MQTKKGFILIYTLLVGIICLIIMMYIFDIQMSEIKYSTSNKRYVLRDDNYQRDKEYLMTLFSTYINTNKEQIKLGIRAFFSGSTGVIVNHGNAKVTYSNTTNEFIFATPYETNAYRNDYYKLVVLGEGFNTIFVKTIYTNK